MPPTTRRSAILTIAAQVIAERGIKGATVRDIGESDWPQLAEKAAALAEAGDLPQAIDVIDQAEGAKPASLSNWRDRAAGRLALLAALDQVDQAVLRQIAQQGGAQ